MKATRWTRYFTVNGETREFMYTYGSKDKTVLQPFIRMIKGQGDIYRITKTASGYYKLWDARYP